MGYVQIPDELKTVIDNQVANGLVPSQGEFLAEAVRLYADYLAVGAEVLNLVQRANADVAAGRFISIGTGEDAEALHQRAMDRLVATMGGDR